MSLKLEIAGNYLKITNGAALPVRVPYRRVYFAANDTNETISLYDDSFAKMLVDKYAYADSASTGSVTIDTIVPTPATGTVQLASAVPNTFSTATVQSVTTLENVFATQTIQFNSAVAVESASGTVTCATAIEGNTVVVNGLTYTGVDGVKADNTEFSVDTGDNETATDLALSITDDARVGDVNDVTAVAVGAVVTITQTVAGTGGNATPLISSGATLAVSGAVFTGGVDADTITVNGLVYTAVAGAKGDNLTFSIDTSNDAAATDLADSINNDVRAGTSGDVTATALTDTVTVSSDVAGTGGNAITLTSTGGARVVLGGATFSGGVDADTVTINGLVYTAVAGAKSDNTEFSNDTSNDATATDLADSINNDVRSGTLGDVSATALTDTVTLTTDVAGVAGDAITLTSTAGIRLVLSGATFGSGVDADTVTANGLVYTAYNGARPDDTYFDVSGTDIAGATDLAAAITADVRVGTVNDLTAASGGTDTVTMTASVGGLIGNTVTLISSDAGRLLTSGATFSGGLDDATVSGITVNAIQIMSGAETGQITKELLATEVAANITAFTSTPNYTAAAVGAVITITPDDEDTDTNGYVVTSTVAQATSTDANLAGGDADIDTGAGVPFASWADLITFLENKTGGDAI